MTDFVEYYSSCHPRFRVADFAARSFRPEILESALARLAEKGAGILHAAVAGNSFEGRPVRLITAGTGASTVLLWSQMHGDESTATMAICDILNFLIGSSGEPHVREILAACTLYFLPMLNPDGAARFQRRTAQGIDMNRDARVLRTPEARLLRDLQKRLKPAFGFNLHDQELSTVGASRDITALSLLAPASDAAKSENDVRRRAKQVAAVFADAMNALIPGRLARYDDSFEPRAFGDNMQAWGTSTVLVESGHVPGDAEKDTPRRLNFIGILASLNAIASGSFAPRDTGVYENLPFNGKRAYDVVVRNVRILDGTKAPVTADLGISSQVDTHSEPPAKLVDIGDLNPFAGMVDVDAKGKTIQASECRLGSPFEWQQHFA